MLFCSFSEEEGGLFVRRCEARGGGVATPPGSPKGRVRGRLQWYDHDSRAERAIKGDGVGGTSSCGSCCKKGREGLTRAGGRCPAAGEGGRSLEGGRVRARQALGRREEGGKGRRARARTPVLDSGASGAAPHSGSAG